MPQGRRTLSDDAVLQASQAAFTPSAPESFGVELEWPVHRIDDVTGRPSEEQMAAIEGLTLPSGGRITFEPGGQLELSTAPAPSVAGALAAADVDTLVLHAHLVEHGLAARTLAVDQRRPPRRVLDRPRYRAMAAYFARQGAAGAWMMCNTASTQVNISHDPADPAQRWAVLHRIAPVLIAAFANSPGRDASGRRWASLRQAVWGSIDPCRTRPVPATGDPALAWRDYALAADVLVVNGASGATAAPPGLTFGRWMSAGHDLGWPTIEDYCYHLTTLFPPVRPRGWLELRVLDALPDWVRDCATVAVATAATRDAGRQLLARLPDTTGLWLTAARDGLARPELAAAARTLFDVVGQHVGAATDDLRLADQLAEFTGRYVRRGRCPGDDLAAGFAPGARVEQRRPALTCG